jgi:hypothetical protein
MIADCVTCPMRQNLETRVTTLESNYKTLQSEHETLRSEHNSLKLTVNILESKDRAISLREIARNLEGHICLQAAGSKKLAMRQLFRFEKFKNSNREGELRKILESLGLTELMIQRLKEGGDEVAHYNRDILTVSEVEKLLKTPYDDEDDLKEIKSFISALYFFELVQADGLVNVSRKPF